MWADGTVKAHQSTAPVGLRCAQLTHAATYVELDGGFIIRAVEAQWWLWPCCNHASHLQREGVSLGNIVSKACVIHIR